MTQAEKKNNPIQTYKDWEANYKAQKAQRELQNIRQGLFRREDKIVLLESILYTRIQDNDSIEDIVMALEVLQANKVSDEELRRKQENCFAAQLNGVIAFAVGVGIVATVVSYVSLPLCGGSQSKFCVGGRIIPGYINDIFREPEHYKSRVLLPN